MMDKKLATKKEIDKTIDKVLIKKYGKLRWNALCVENL
jgi:hypothetical protein